MSKRLLLIFIVFAVSVLGVCVLYWVTTYEQRSPNHFVRILPSHLLSPDKVGKMGSAHFYLAGVTNKWIFLADKISKNSVMRLDRISLKNSSVLLKSGQHLDILQDAYLKFDGVHIFLIDGAKQSIGYGQIAKMRIEGVRPSLPFTVCAPLTPDSWLMKTNQRGLPVLLKQNAGKADVVNKTILKPQGDNLFSVDGMLIKAPEANRVFYIYYYRNEILALDTNLKQLYIGHTIDTNRHAKIKVGKINSTNELTLTAPPVFVNKQAAANSSYLFIRSALRADNETKDSFNEGAAIDVYQVKDGKYLFTIYLPDLEGRKLVSFDVYDKTLAGFYGDYLYTFKLNF